MKNIGRKTKRYPKGKPTVDYSVKWLEWKIKGLESEYDKLSKDYAKVVSQGYGLEAMGILDTLRSLAFLYSDIAAHRHALHSLKAEIV